MLTEGVMAMDTTLVGIIEVDPMQLFTEGIYREVSQRISRSLNRILVVTNG